MAPKKGKFGYTKGLDRYTSKHSTEWVDVSSFLLEGEDVLPDEAEEKPSFFWVKLFIIFAVGMLGFRLTHLQIVEGSENRYLAEGNRIRRQITIAPRGNIIDRKGHELVTNKAGYSLEIVPSDLPRTKEVRVKILDTLAQTTQLPRDQLVKKLEQVGLMSLDPLTIQANITREQALVYKIKFATTPGVRVAFSPTRQYATTPGLSHLLGYTSRMTEEDIKKHPDYHQSSPIGRAGVESSYDVSLRGEAGINEIEVNASGQYQRTLRNIPPQVGKTLRLTLDHGLQQEMVVALQEAMGKNNARQSVGIALDPRTGGILASVSLPSYDNNLFATGITAEAYKALSDNPDKPLLNRAVDGVYPPGSTLKPFVAAAALQEKTISPSTRLDTSVGVIKIGQWEFPDWKVHGVTDIKQAIAESNDIMFYALGGGWDKIPGLGVERLKKYSHLFGFGKETGVDYATERMGLVPDPEWKKRVQKESWYIGDTYHIAIGQGNFLATPLQLGRALSSIINGGRLVTPHIVDRVEGSDGTSGSLSFPEEKLHLSEDVLQTVREGMRQTVVSDSGSARALRSLPFTSAGKTGTAQFGTEEKTHAWYIGFAPYENPEIVVVVLVEGGGEGNAISVPVAGRVFDYYMSHKE